MGLHCGRPASSIRHPARADPAGGLAYRIAAQARLALGARSSFRGVVAITNDFRPHRFFWLDLKLRGLKYLRSVFRHPDSG
jgi:hypothetical protein